MSSLYQRSRRYVRDRGLRKLSVMYYNNFGHPRSVRLTESSSEERWCNSKRADLDQKRSLSFNKHPSLPSDFGPASYLAIHVAVCSESSSVPYQFEDTSKYHGYREAKPLLAKNALGEEGEHGYTEQHSERHVGGPVGAIVEIRACGSACLPCT